MLTELQKAILSFINELGVKTVLELRDQTQYRHTSQEMYELTITGWHDELEKLRKRGLVEYRFREETPERLADRLGKRRVEWSLTEKGKEMAASLLHTNRETINKDRGTSVPKVSEKSEQEA